MKRYIALISSVIFLIGMFIAVVYCAIQMTHAANNRAIIRQAMK